MIPISQKENKAMFLLHYEVTIDSYIQTENDVYFSIRL